MDNLEAKMTDIEQVLHSRAIILFSVLICMMSIIQRLSQAEKQAVHIDAQLVGKESNQSIIVSLFCVSLNMYISLRL